MAELPWPSDLGFATLIGDYRWMVGDQEDEDRLPDQTPLDGVITVEPSVKSSRYVGAQGNVFYVKNITRGVIRDGRVSTVKSDGSVSDGIVVPATDDPNLSPTDFTYLVKISATGFSTSFNIKAPADSTIDLALASPIPSSGGTAIVVDGTTAERAETAASRAEAAADAAEEWTPEFEWVDTSLSVNGGVPVDLKGPKGDGFEYDSGERDITSFVPDVVSGRVFVWRLSRTVHLTFDSLIVAAPDTPHWLTISGLLTVGFRGANRSRYYQFAQQIGTYASGPVRIDSGGSVVIYNAKQTDGNTRVIQGTVAFPTPAELPTSLPGDPI